MSRSKVLLAALLLLGAGAAVGAVFWWCGTRPAPPAVDLSGADPAVAQAVEQARQAVLQAPRSAAAWGKLGQVLLAHGFRQESTVCFVRAEQLDPREPRWPYYQGYILSLDDLEAAAAKYRRAADLGGDGADVARLRLAAALLELGRADEAEQELHRVLDANPNDPPALLLLGRAESARGALPESLEHLTSAAAFAGTRKGALTASAAVRRRLGEADGAAKELALADDLPDDPPPPDPFLDEVGRMQRGKQGMLRRAEELLNAGRVSEAVGWFRDLAEQYPDTDWAWLRLGRALLQMGDLAGAEAALQKALERSPDLVDAHFYLGVVLYQRKDYAAAAARFRRAVGLKPDYALAQFNLGECLMRLGDRDGARQAFRAAVDSKPALAEAHAELAALLADDGRPAEARAEAEETLRLDPSNERAKAVLAAPPASPPRP